MSANVVRLFGGAEPPADDRALADLGRDDIGNAERLLAREGANLRCTAGLGVFWFDGKRWKLDHEEWEAQKAAQRTARAILREVEALRGDESLKGDEPEQKKERSNRLTSHRKWMTSSSNSARLKAMLAQAWPHVSHPFEAWNAMSNILNVENGRLNLAGLEPQLDAHRRDDFITHIAGCAYEPEAKAPRFLAFLERVLPDPDVRAFVKRSAGACLIDSAHDQAIVVHHGGGANGKSTFLNAVSGALGDYSLTAAVESLLYNERGGGDAAPDIVRLAERPRLVRVSEPEPGAKLSESAVKQITGGEPIAARQMYEKQLVEFLPNFKVHLSCNNRPAIRGGDDGIWRRILLVSWSVQIPVEERDLDLPDKLDEERAGILNWLIEGLADYRERGGLAPPAQVLEASEEYRADSDVVGRFIQECCDRAVTFEESGARLHDAFKRWSIQGGTREKDILSVNIFSRRLTDRGYAKRKTNGDVMRQGLMLNADGSGLADEAARIEAAAAERRSGRDRAAGEDVE